MRKHRDWLVIMEICEFKDYAPVAEKFGLIFGIRMGKFIDNMRSAVEGRPVINLFKFDDWLHEKHGNYDMGELSMQDIIIKYYGNEANEIVKRFI